MNDFIRELLIIGSVVVLGFQTYWAFLAWKARKTIKEERLSEVQQEAQDREERRKGREVCSMELSAHDLSLMARDKVIADYTEEHGEAPDFDLTQVKFLWTKDLKVTGIRVVLYSSKRTAKGKLQLVKG